ncbi:GntR family transcriptional regulator [Rhodophyticola sp. CCM32]|uniref:GntR family transcriptional regulator n=1 Tax=Rhodophyticola sp. CCM32 TaxID=2916397 RepID=UPI00143D8D56|nr:GntR family transcriptional regulator [Rhodophyticola sp. CCM32]
MDWILTKRMGPGSTINEAKFAHEMGISNTSAREFLLKLSRFGFLRKEPYKTWSLEGVSDEYADEIMEVRLLFETSAVARLARKDDNDPFWNDLNRIRKKHETLIAHLEHGAIEMPGLDAEFHNLLNAAAGRRLILAIQDVISMIFHYHYHHIWKEEQRLAMAALALQDHIEIIDAIQTKNEELARERMQKHLSNARYALKRPPYRFMTPAIQTHTPHDTRSEG